MTTAIFQTTLSGGALLAALLVSFAPARAQPTNCMAAIAAMPDANRFAVVAKATQQDKELAEDGPFTIFLPLNSAIAEVRATLAPMLFPNDPNGEAMDPVLARAAVNAHILNGRYISGAVKPGETVTTRTRAGNQLQVTNAGGAITLRGTHGAEARVVRADIPCANGVIHVIDKSLVR